MFSLSVGTMLTSWSNAYSVSLNFVKAALNTIWTVVQDSQGLAQAVNTTYQIVPPALAPISVAVKYLFKFSKFAIHL